jgi:hypothetical protein
MPSTELLQRILRGVPNLPGARCTEPGNRALFDSCAAPGGTKLHGRAIAVCATCPALAPCRSWVAGLRPGAPPHGVVGGMVRRRP